jgi:hypothetical protein
MSAPGTRAVILLTRGSAPWWDQFYSSGRYAANMLLDFLVMRVVRGVAKLAFGDWTGRQ